jgi:hypothetical protein
MRSKLPFLNIDDQLDFNLSLVILIIHKLSYTTAKAYKLNFSKLQLFLFLIKNPSRINEVLIEAGKKPAIIESKYVYTIESYSLNTDILGDKAKTIFLLRKLISLGLVSIVTDKGNGICYKLTIKGNDTVEKLTSEYFLIINQLIAGIKPLNTFKSDKLYSIFNKSFNK